MEDGVVELAEKVRKGLITPEETVEAALERIRKLNPILNCFTVVCEEEARREAKEQTKRIRAGEVVGPLAGIPFAVKDLEDVKGMVTSYGAVPFANREPAKRDSIQVARLRAAGAIVVGKTNVPPFGSTIMTKNQVYGVTRNPWDTNLTPGGSSGGSACCVAAGIVPFATAADGGGSIRAPACFTGTFGLKPTRGLVPMTEGHRLGMDRFVHCVGFGPITRNVEDAALILDITAGYHPDDPFSLPKPSVSFLKSVSSKTPLRPLKILFSADFGFISSVDEGLLNQALEAATILKKLGHTVLIESQGEAAKGCLPDPEMNWALGMGLQEREMVLPNLKSEEMKLMDRGLLSSWNALESLPASELGEVFRFSFKLNRRLDEIFQEFDILASLAMPIPPFQAEGPIPVEAFDNPLHVVGFLSVFNFSGHPAATVRLPRSFSGRKMGGLQLVAQRHEDALVLELSKQYQAYSGCFESWPSVLSPSSSI